MVYKRPTKEKIVGDIGPWMNVWTVLGYLAIVISPIFNFLINI